MIDLSTPIATESYTAQLFYGWCFDRYCGLDQVNEDNMK